MTEKELPTGYACSSCGEANAFDPYVYAHWDTLLTHKCKTCETDHFIVRGIAKPLKRIAPPQLN